MKYHFSPSCSKWSHNRAYSFAGIFVILGMICAFIVFVTIPIFKEAKRNEANMKFLDDLEAGKFTRATVKRAIEGLDMIAIRKEETRRTATYVICSQELAALEKEDPPLSDLIRTRYAGTQPSFSHPTSGTILPVVVFEDYDALVVQARKDVNLAQSKLPIHCKISVDGELVKIVTTVDSKNSQGLVVEKNDTTVYPMSWAQKYAPQLIK